MNKLTRSILTKCLSALSSNTCRHKDLKKIPSYGTDIVCAGCGKRWHDEATDIGRDPHLDLINQLEANLVEMSLVAVVRNKAGKYLYMDENMDPQWTNLPSRADEFSPDLAYQLCKQLQKARPADHIYYIQYPTNEPTEPISITPHTGVLTVTAADNTDGVQELLHTDSQGH